MAGAHPIVDPRPQLMPLLKAPSPSSWNFRLALACFVAVSVSLPIAWMSLSKVALFIAGLVYIFTNLARGKTDDADVGATWTPKLILFIIFVFGASLLWSTVDLQFALQTLVKHSKILDIVLLVYLIRSAPEARRVVGVFVAAQVAVLLLSWLAAIGFPVPWVSVAAEPPGTRYVVFAESYIDQSLMFCVLAAVAWHIHSSVLKIRWVAGCIALLALGNVFFLLSGRTGYITGIAVVSLAAWWAVSSRYRVWVLLGLPLLMLSALFFANSQSNQRLNQVATDLQQYSKQTDVVNNSSGWRLNAWHRSLQAIAEHPAIGYGVGSWATAVKSFEGSDANAVFGVSNNSNPHQEYLLWGVELGPGGALLLMGLLLCLAWDARAFPTPARRCMYSVLAVVGLACLFNSALYDDLLGDYLCVAMGIVFAYGIRHASPHNTPHEALSLQ